MPTGNSIAGLPGPSHITLLFKHDKSTTVLSLLPSQTLKEAKALLLDVLKSRGIATFPGTSIQLPESASGLELAVTRDRRDGRDPSKGWVDVEDVSLLINSTKPGKKKGNVNEESSAETIGDLDLKDGAYVAYRLRQKVEDLVDEGMDEDLEDQAPDMGWNVVIPSFEEDEVEATSDALQNTADDDDDEDDDDEDFDIPIPVPRNPTAK